MAQHDRRRNLVVTERVEVKPQPRWERLHEQLLVFHEYIDHHRAKYKKWFASSFIGLFYNNFMICISVFSLLSFIIQTYFNKRDFATKQYFDYIDWCLAALFTWDWILNFTLTDNKYTFLCRYFL